MSRVLVSLRWSRRVVLTSRISRLTDYSYLGQQRAHKGQRLTTLIARVFFLFFSATQMWDTKLESEIASPFRPPSARLVHAESPAVPLATNDHLQHESQHDFQHDLQHESHDFQHESQHDFQHESLHESRLALRHELQHDLQQMLGEVSEKGCRCRSSKCIKMYCDCFAANRYCTAACVCSGCENVTTNEASLKRTRASIQRRNPNAFQNKVERRHGTRRHAQGCRCTRSMCLKRYCECFKAGIQCTSACSCHDCRNGRESFSELPQLGIGVQEQSANDGLADLLAIDPSLHGFLE